MKGAFSEKVMRENSHGFSWRWIFFIVGLVGVVWFSIPFACHVYNIGSILAMFFCITCVMGSCLLPWFSSCFSVSVRKIIRRIFAFCMVAGVLWVSFLSGCMIKGTANGPKVNTEYTLIILGSKVNGISPSADLRQRIQAAEDYLKIHPEAKAVASGGQGAGEDISEAQAIQDALVRRGIEKDRVYLENRSQNTKENIAFSMEVIHREGLCENILLVTDEYHQFRAGRIADKQGIETKSLCAHTPWYIFSACWARELLALTAHFFTE